MYGVDGYVQYINTLGLNRVDYQRTLPGISKVRKLHNLAGWGVGVQYRVHCPDVQTALRGLIQRVFLHKETAGGVAYLLPPHKPTRELVLEKLGKSRSNLLRRTYTVLPYTRERFLAPLSGSKLARYVAGADAYEEHGVTPKDAYLQTFVKAEKLNVSAKEDPDPRVIQPRTPKYCYALGRYIKAAEHSIYQAIDRMMGGKTVMKGLNADKRGQAFLAAWNQFVDPVAVGLDASRFDQHVSRALLEFEHSVYNSMFRDPELKALLKMQLVNKGFVRCEDGNIKYTVDGSRMSGDMNTSLGNVLLMCLMVDGFLSEAALNARLLNDGDDCVLIMEHKDLWKLDALPSYFTQLGMIMKVEEAVSTLEEIEFCQSHPVEITPGKWRMVRDPRTVLSKDCHVVKPVNNLGTWKMFRYAISQCGLSLAGDVPVFNEFYTALGRGADLSKRSRSKLASRGPETGMDYLSLGMKAKYREPHTCCRISFAKAFDIWPDTQVAMEQKYRTLEAVWRTPEDCSHVVDVFDLYN